MVNQVHGDPGVAGLDPLDARLASASAHAIKGGTSWRRRRPALGLGVTPLPVSVLLCAGIAAGPNGTALFSPRLLDAIGPPMAVCLAAIGVLIGLQVDMRSRADWKHMARGIVYGAIPALLVGGALWVSARFALVPSALPAVVLIVIAVSSVTSAVAGGGDGERGRLGEAVQPVQFVDLVAVAGGAAAIAALAEPTPAAALWLAVNAASIGAAIAVAAAVLIAQAPAESEQRVYLAGALLLLAGAAVHLSTSSLLTGVLAGVFWNAWRGPARNRIAHDVGYVQHPLMVVLLLAAGASVEFSPDVFVLALLATVVRVVAKVLGRRIVGQLSVASGLVGIAVALDVIVAAGASVGLADAAAVLISVAVLSAIATDLVAIFVGPEEYRADAEHRGRGVAA